MSLSEDLRNELAAIGTERTCDALAELSGLFHTAGSVHLRGRGEVSVHLDVASSAVARRAFTLLRAVSVEAEIRSYRSRAFDRPLRYQLHVAGEPHALRVLGEAGVLTTRLAPREIPPKRVVARACCRRAYLRGALLGAGSLSGPQAPHLEIRSAGAAGARFVASVAAAEGARLSVIDRARYAAAYAKGADAIEDVLAAAGASGAVLSLAERTVVGITRGRANRLANADHANLVRTARAAHAQLDAVRRLEETGALATLSPRLQEIAALRRRHPSLSLRELASRCDPPATKAASSAGWRSSCDSRRCSPPRPPSASLAMPTFNFLRAAEAPLAVPLEAVPALPAQPSKPDRPAPEGWAAKAALVLPLRGCAGFAGAAV